MQKQNNINNENQANGNSNSTRGEGSITSITKKGVTYLRYRKYVDGHQLEVTGKTEKEIRKKMREKEIAIIKGVQRIKNGSVTLKEAMLEWHNTVRILELLPRTWDRELHTINNQIFKYPIARKQMQAITSKDINSHLIDIMQNYSVSVVFKTYDAFKLFFDYYFKNNSTQNPMISIKKPKKKAARNVRGASANENGNHLRDGAEREFFDVEDIKKFTVEALRCYPTGTPIYRYGSLLCFALYALLRVGELQALRWSDIDMETGEVNVHAAMSYIIDHSTPSKNGKHKYIYVEGLPKYHSVRRVYVPLEAIEYLKVYKRIVNPKSENERICASQTGEITSQRNLNRCLKGIQKKAGTKMHNVSMHGLRHSGITFYVKAGVEKTTVARMAGQRDLSMINDVYLHITEQDKINAARSVSIPK